MGTHTWEEESFCAEVWAGMLHAKWVLQSAAPSFHYCLAHAMRCSSLPLHHSVNCVWSSFSGQTNYSSIYIVTTDNPFIRDAAFPRLSPHRLGRVTPLGRWRTLVSSCPCGNDDDTREIDISWTLVSSCPCGNDDDTRQIDISWTLVSSCPCGNDDDTREIDISWTLVSSCPCGNDDDTREIAIS
jgi:ferredoxin-thioredoxin reductase catalytic subunit